VTARYSRLVLAALVLATACRRASSAHQDGGATLSLRTRTALFVLSASGHLRAQLAGQGTATRDLHVAEPAPQLLLGDTLVNDVWLDVAHAIDVAPLALPRLPGRAVEAKGHGAGDVEGIDKKLRLEVYDELPGLAFLQATYTNTSARPLMIARVVAQRWQLAGRAGAPPLWSFHGSSEQAREEALLPLTPGFERTNMMGAMTSAGRGGGLPLVAFWSRDAGVMLGLAETTPRILSLPVKVDQSGRTCASVELQPPAALAPGASFTTPLLLVGAFSGDYYDAVRAWISALTHRGLVFPAALAAAYEPSWCGWGFGPAVTPQQMVGALPAVKRLGFKWATLDEGALSNVGDGKPRPDFGLAGIRGVLNAYHAAGVRVQLWWLPLAVEYGGERPGHRQRRIARVAGEHPEWLILDPAGQPVHIFGGFALLCPAVAQVRDYHVALTRRFLGEWGFDGLKIDKVFTVPPCYNPAHGHRTPSESVERMGEVFRAIYDTAHAIRPQAVLQICSCASLPNLAWLPFMDQSVTADPDGPAQVRWRTKLLKAIYGPRAPVYADHVELTTTRLEGNRELTYGSDFASALGVGAVPGTRFVWPPLPGLEDVALTPERELHFRKWLDLYRNLRLAEGEFRNLYVYGFDTPEAYAIEKGGRIYYAFFADAAQPVFRGAVELRGLLSGHKYRVRDYEREEDFGTVSGPMAKLTVEFRRRLLLKATPQ
jgi:alpha-galactosidase